MEFRSIWYHKNSCGAEERNTVPRKSWGGKIRKEKGSNNWQLKKLSEKSLHFLYYRKGQYKPAASKNNPKHPRKLTRRILCIMMNITKPVEPTGATEKKFHEDALLELAESIKQYGVLYHFWCRRGRIII